MKEMTDLVFGNFALVDLVDLVDLVCNFAPIIFIKYGNNAMIKIDYKYLALI